MPTKEQKKKREKKERRAEAARPPVAATEPEPVPEPVPVFAAPAEPVAFSAQDTLSAPDTFSAQETLSAPASKYAMVEKGPVCSDKFSDDPLLNVPRDVISYDGNEFSASPCSQKCLFSYNYSASSSCVVTNEGDRLTIIYDGGGDVTFNSATYLPTRLRLFKPSLHKFNGVQAEGELIIEHSARSASNTGLLVCIPLSSNGALSNASAILEDIIKNSPTVEDASEALSISDFTLNHLIPTAPYYTYTGPLPYDVCIDSATYQYVVFHPSRSGAIALASNIMEGLGAMISQSFIVAFKEKGLFFNATGTSKNGFSGEDQIYIQCQPVGASAETKMYKDTKDPSLRASGDATKTMNLILYVLLGIVIIVVSFKLMEFILRKVSKSQPTYSGPES
jgi:hypothetical protein